MKASFILVALTAASAATASVLPRETQKDKVTCTISRRISSADCKKAAQELRDDAKNGGKINRGAGCDRMWRPEYEYVKVGTCRITTYGEGNPQCFDPVKVADSIDKILAECNGNSFVMDAGEVAWNKKEGVRLSL